MENVFIGKVNGTVYNDPSEYAAAIKDAVQRGKNLECHITYTPNTKRDHRDTDKKELKQTAKLIDFIANNDLLPTFDLDSLSGDREQNCHLIDAFNPRISDDSAQRAANKIIEQTNRNVTRGYDSYLYEAFKRCETHLDLNTQAQRATHIERARVAEEINKIQAELKKLEDEAAGYDERLRLYADADDILRKEMNFYKKVHSLLPAEDHFNHYKDEGDKHSQPIVNGAVKKEDQASEPHDAAQALTNGVMKLLQMIFE